MRNTAFLAGLLAIGAAEVLLARSRAPDCGPDGREVYPGDDLAAKAVANDGAVLNEDAAVELLGHCPALDHEAVGHDDGVGNDDRLDYGISLRSPQAIVLPVFLRSLYLRDAVGVGSPSRRCPKPNMRPLTTTRWSLL